LASKSQLCDRARKGEDFRKEHDTRGLWAPRKEDQLCREKRARQRASDRASELQGIGILINLNLGGEEVAADGLAPGWCGQGALSGVPAVLEQKTTICCKLLCLLTSKQGVSPAYSRERTHVEGVEENPFYELNPTLSVGNIRTLLPRYAWTKPFVFLHSLTVYQRCVVFCTLTTGTPIIGTAEEDCIHKR
jgi:hypothetical protein